MSVLLAVKSCQRDLDRGCHDIIRSTWGKDVPDVYGAYLRFFVGAVQEPEKISQGDVFINVPDDYDSLPFKTREILRWSLRHDYDYTFLCDTDTFIIPRLLMRCGFEKYDVAARFGTIHPVGGPTFDYTDGRGHQGQVHPWPSGGLGYFVSRKAAEIIVAAEIKFWAEDMHVGQVLGEHIQKGELLALDIPDYECNTSWHWPRRATGKAYDHTSGWMERMQKEHGQ